ncbi:homoserine dehydrogenase, partial [Enterococcus faecium]
LEAIAALFAQHEVSLRTVRQEDGEDTARLIVVTHAAKEATLENIVSVLGELDEVEAVHSVIRLGS